MYSNRDIFIAIDFDGTCVKHAFPEIGDDIGAVPALKALAKMGYKLILNSMRDHPSDKANNPELKKLGLVPTRRDTLQEAIDWFNRNGITLYAANDNPSQNAWTDSRKIYAHLYIDDAALGVPLVTPDNERPYVDWKGVMLWMAENDWIDDETYKEYFLSTLPKDEE